MKDYAENFAYIIRKHALIMRKLHPAGPDYAEI